MNGLTLLLIAGVIFIVGYIVYGSYLAKKWGLDEARKTPAETLRDDVDYCPADAKVVLGHQFSSIAGAGPITGPIQAIIFGWLPVFLWVVIGSVFIGGVHDWGSMFASLRHEGKSIGEVIKANIGATGKKLFNLFAWVTLVLVVAAFTDICAGTFAYNPENGDLTGAMAGTASVLFIFLAMVFGFCVYRRNMNLVISTVLGIAIMFVCIIVGYYFPVLQLSKTVWTVILIIYIICASVLPVWILLQPRDYLCSFLLYAMLIGGVLGIVVMRPEIVMPAFNGFVVGEGAKTQFLFPALFITVACGAVSGFHSLVSSGTTSKQIKNEKDSKLIGYGAMLIEGFVAIIAIIAVAYLAKPGTGTPVQQFSAGIANFMSGFGLPVKVGQVFVTLAFSSFALTSLDTATRIARYMFQELVAKENPVKDAKPSLLENSMVATIITVAGAIGLLMYGYGNIWPIFGAANQLLAGLSLLAITAWFIKTKKAILPTLIPMIFMFVVTLSALCLLGYQFIVGGKMILGVLAVILLVLAIVLIVIASKVFFIKSNKVSKENKIEQ